MKKNTINYRSLQGNVFEVDNNEVISFIINDEMNNNEEELNELINLLDDTKVSYDYWGDDEEQTLIIHNTYELYFKLISNNDLIKVNRF